MAFTGKYKILSEAFSCNQLTSRMQHVPSLKNKSSIDHSEQSCTSVRLSISVKYFPDSVYPVTAR